MPITVDTNSGEDAVFAALERGCPEGATLERRRLDVGDLCVEDAGVQVIIERKTWADLAASVCDGRFQEQKSRMIASETVRYAYAIEGSSVEAWDGFHRGMRNKALWAAVVKTALRDEMTVFHTRSPEDTAELAAYLWVQLRDGGFRPGGGRPALAGVQKRKRHNLVGNPEAVLRHMLTTIDLVSATRAETLVQAFPTVSDLVAATPVQIATLTCGGRALGACLARNVKAVFH